jgi:transcriptional regulator with XRE-family HTH domain
MHRHPSDNRPPPRQTLARVRVTKARESPTVDCMSATWPVEDFNEYLRALMTNAGIPDYAELSRLTGVSQSQFSLWRRGKTQPSRANLKRIYVPLGLKSPVTLYVAAGLDAEEDLELGERLDFTVLPKPFDDLREVYERLNSFGRGPDALRSISVLVAGLRAEVAELEDAAERRRDHRPSGRRRAS